MTLPDFMNKSLIDLMARMMGNPLITMFPSLSERPLTAADGRFIRNCKTLRSHIEKIINERKSGLSHSYHGGSEKDLFDALLSDEFY